MIDPTVLTIYLKHYLQSKKFWAIVSVVILGIGTFAIGSVHFISGSDYHGLPVVNKLSFGFAETFINADQITGMPYIVAKSQYPLSVLALQRVGYLETDEARARRFEDEYKEKMARIQAEIERNLAKTQADIEAAFNENK